MNRRIEIPAGILLVLALALSSWDPPGASGDSSGGAAVPRRRLTRPQAEGIPPSVTHPQRPATAIDFSIFLPPAAGTRSQESPLGVASTAAPLAPAITSSFPGLLDDLTTIPPDTMGAAGPTHLVSFLNTDVGFFTRGGVLLNPGFKLRDFWAPIAPNPARGIPANFFDPKVLYDQHSGRFVAMTLDGDPPDRSWVLLAQSNTSDPTQGWRQWALPADNNFWADYPGLGVDNNNIYIATNLFDNVTPSPNFHYIKVWIVPKTSLPPTGQDLTNATAISNPFNYLPLNTGPFSFQPAHVFGTPGTAYIVGEHNPPGSALRIGRIWPLPFADLGAVAVSSYSVPSTLPPAPLTNIDTGDSRILNVVSRNGHLFATHTIPDASRTKTAARWYEISTTPLIKVQEGTIEATISAPNRFYYYPSLAVNSAGDIAIGFSGSSASPQEYTGAYYTVGKRQPNQTNVFQPVTLLKSGRASYFKKFSGTANRWGDFSATVVDPVDDSSFWTLQEIADTPHQTEDRWATWWGSFGPPAIDPPTDLSVTESVPSSRFQLTWTNAAQGTDNIVVERRTAPDGDFAAIDVLPTTATAYTDAFAATAGTTYFYRVRVGDATGRSYSNEAYVKATSGGGGGGGGGGCLSATGTAPVGNPLTEAASIGFLLFPVAAIPARKQLRRLRRKNPLRHPVC